MTLPLKEDIFSTMKLLEQARDGIQDIDEQIISLLDERMNYAKIIGAIKRQNNKSIYAPEVEEEKIKQLSKMTKNLAMVETIWPVIFCYTRSIQGDCYDS